MHNIMTLEFPENTPKEKMTKKAEAIAADEGSCLYNRIIFEDRIFKNEKEAIAYIEEMSQKHDYDQRAVLFEEPAKPLKSKKIDDQLERVKSLNDVYTTISREPHFKEAKSAYISCKKCGSKLNKEYIKNTCPVCNADLRPETTLKKIARAKAVLDEAKNKLEKIKDAEAEKVKKKKTWLLKIEYHT